MGTTTSREHLIAKEYDGIFTLGTETGATINRGHLIAQGYDGIFTL